MAGLNTPDARLSTTRLYGRKPFAPQLWNIDVKRKTLRSKLRMQPQPRKSQRTQTQRVEPALSIETTRLTSWNPEPSLEKPSHHCEMLMSKPVKTHVLG